MSYQGRHAIRSQQQNNNESLGDDLRRAIALHPRREVRQRPWAAANIEFPVNVSLAVGCQEARKASTTHPIDLRQMLNRSAFLQIKEKSWFPFVVTILSP